MKMKFLLILFTVGACASAMSLFDQKFNDHWEMFKKSYNRSYKTTHEESYRRMIWEKNFKRIEKHNAEFKNGKRTFTQRMNKFGDMTNEEFRFAMNGYKMNMKVASAKVYEPKVTDIPDSVDWRQNGYVTPVKDQGDCGSCWAFSAVASLEGQHFKASGTLVSLSEQNLVDCSRSEGNEGCDGGLMDQAFTYIKLNNGIDTEKSYPYEASENNRCNFQPEYIGATVSGFVDIFSGSEANLTNAIANVGPISVAIDASQDSFQFYDSGVYYEPDCSSTDLDHGVTAVGYGAIKFKHGEQDYYIVKNSWGEDWGDDGYILMSRNQNNNCGIATQASYPIV